MIQIKLLLIINILKIQEYQGELKNYINLKIRISSDFKEIKGLKLIFILHKYIIIMIENKRILIKDIYAFINYRKEDIFIISKSLRN